MFSNADIYDPTIDGAPYGAVPRHAAPRFGGDTRYPPPLVLSETWGAYATGKLSAVGVANWESNVGTREMQVTAGTPILGVEAGDVSNPISVTYGHKTLTLDGSKTRRLRVSNLVGSGWPQNSTLGIVFDRTTKTGSGTQAQLASMFTTQAIIRFTLTTTTGTSTYDYPTTGGQGVFSFDSVEIRGAADGSIKIYLNGVQILSRTGAARNNTFRYFGLQLSEPSTALANVLRLGTLSAYGSQI